MRRKYTDEEVAKAVKDSVSIAGVLRQLGLRPIGGNYRTLNRLIQDLNYGVCVSDIKNSQDVALATVAACQNGWGIPFPWRFITSTGSIQTTGLKILFFSVPTAMHLQIITEEEQH